MSGLNRASIIGRLGKDPEIRHTQDGSAVANVSIATSESWKDKTSGEKQERTEWHNVVFFGRLAEIAGEYLKKGAQIYVEGRIQTRKWQDKEGKDRYTTEIVASDLKMLGGKRENDHDQGAAEPHAQARKPAAAARTGGGGQSGPAPEDFGDDIPFVTNGGIF